jgi:hypothetical protein
MNAVVARTAQQLGISPEKVTLETEIPDIRALALLTGIEIEKTVVVDPQVTYTVEKAIEMFEK